MKHAITSTGVALAFAAASMLGAVPAVSAGEDKTAKVHCYGVNVCKGHNDCKTAENACKGKGACKGQGFVSMSKEACEKIGGTVEE
ncbi:hypothetical protein [Methylophaga sp. OBS4]|uniref:BufA2 family periplasmic bufferin-type metallophore n=1 Tax=Methylophaga sp. OBS4 TaxID=2991935 RepID=UPI00225A40AF|nr:hypothetical protein [Methylophaga sp. OBS4]MCX4186687.1 hypothetical protein [Methylophaga sp. OBS4]